MPLQGAISVALEDSFWRKTRLQHLEFISSELVLISNNKTSAKQLLAACGRTALALEHGCWMGRSCGLGSDPLRTDP